MHLYLVRHGEAAGQVSDAQRRLTPLGRHQAESLAGFLRPLQLRVEATWHSGLVRAVQTAQIVAGAVRAKGRPVAHPGLQPMDKTAPLARQLEQSAGDLMIVGHEPFLGKLASRLLCGKAKAQILALEKGGMVCLRQTEKDQWQVLWALAPQILPQSGVEELSPPTERNKR